MLLIRCSCAHVGLLCFQVLQKPTTEQKHHLAVHSKHVAACVTELVQTAEAMKGQTTYAADIHCHTRLRNMHEKKARLDDLYLPVTPFPMMSSDLSDLIK